MPPKLDASIHTEPIVKVLKIWNLLVFIFSFIKMENLNQSIVYK